MAYNRSEVAQVAEILHRTIQVDRKIERVAADNSIPIDENDDLAITGPAQVVSYLSGLRTKRDAAIAQIKPIVAAWTP
jgi:hypothetical protein